MVFRDPRRDIESLQVGLFDETGSSSSFLPVKINSFVCFQWATKSGFFSISYVDQSVPQVEGSQQINRCSSG